MDFTGDRFIDKNLSLAKAYQKDPRANKTVIRKEAGGEAKEEAQSCWNCKTRNRCDSFRKWRTGGLSGVVSVGEDKQFWCDKWIEDPVDRMRAVTDKDVRSMMRSVRKGRL